jgi:hypothetical protein
MAESVPLMLSRLIKTDHSGQIEIHRSLLNVVLHEEPHINS